MKSSRALFRAATSTLRNGIQRHEYRNPDFEVDHLVVGGGVIGLACAAKLTEALPEKTTYLVERHDKIGQETRNSEVIHAGIYYPLNSLKSQYCVRGRELLYDRCQRLGIGHKKTGKLILATSKDQIQYLDELHAGLQHPILESPTHSPMTGLGVPTYFLGPNEAVDLEPDLGPNVLAAMLSTESGIVDSHALMESLEMEINGQLPGQGTETDAGRGSVVLGTKVVRIDPYRDESGGTLLFLV
ncbi:hypothetical protein QFC19_004520 [Naganishia cerealis]|uniref:Uncharacterized protein n=1 Tax=Naganishia cerealis TaxID=610337 RepID=A0ACC2VUZ8_9TREE|nr:hypothetical protein QFC19_004520 [Naganishia cerealis]